MLVHKYVDRNGSAAMLTAKRSAGVTLEVNLRNMLYAGEEAQVRESTLALNLGKTSPEQSKTGVSVATQKRLVSSKYFFKKSLGYSRLDNLLICEEYGTSVSVSKP